MLKKFTVIGIIIPFIIPYIILYAIYIQFNGETSPGGGFQAGVVFSSSIIAYDLVFGKKLLNKFFPINNLIICGTLGIMIYFIIGIIPIIRGDEFLNYSVLINDSLVSEYIGISVIELGIGLTISSVMCLIYSLIRK